MKNTKTVIFISMLLLSSFQGAFASSDDLKKLFKNINFSIENPAKNTFIFWVNGDAERFRPASGINQDIVRIDKQDVEDVKTAALKCNCNVVLFHDQRGTDKWYTARKAWGAYLEVYSQGHKILFSKKIKKRNTHTRRYSTKIRYTENSSVSEVNQADPGFLKELLRYTEKLFPNSDIHLVYRGHSFNESYDPNKANNIIAPFDYSHVESAYSVDTFIESLNSAKLNKKLSSITFASCTMSYIESILKLSKYTESLISSQIPILETGSTGFDLSFIDKINDSLTLQEINELIGNNIYNKFKSTNENTDIIREAVISSIDLRGFKDSSDRVEQLVNAIKSHSLIAEQSLREAQISVKPSNRYIEMKINTGISPRTIETLKEKVQFGIVSNSYDFFKILKSIDEDKNFVKELQGRVTLFGYSTFSSKLGINIKI
jgi:hypothetical protein